MVFTSRAEGNFRICLALAEIRTQLLLNRSAERWRYASRKMYLEYGISKYRA
jgi:hypothetical protein